MFKRKIEVTWDSEDDEDVSASLLSAPASAPNHSFFDDDEECVPCADQSGGPRVFSCDLCDYKSNHPSNLKRHKAARHDIDVVWFVCNHPGCEHKAKTSKDLKRHKADVHDIGVVWHACDHLGCDFKTKHATNLKQHKANKHDIGVVWHVCDHLGCDFKTKQAGHLKQHKAYKHDADVAWHVCDHPGCEFKTKEASTLKHHKAYRHEIGVVWHLCDHPGCEFKTKHTGNLTKHKAYRHEIGVVWYLCDHPGCKYKTKHASNLRQHKTNKHDIGVVWHLCDQCEHKAKHASQLKQHKANVHDIGVVWHKCDADPDKCDHQCKQLCHLYDHIRTQHARVYAQRKKEQEERVRRVLLDAHWQEWRLAESMPPVGHFRREKRIDFKCAKLATNGNNARIDFVLGVPNGFVFLEVDEQQHKYGYDGLVSCDMKRMSQVMESLAVETDCNLPCIYWLRYNPHAWHVDGALRRMLKVEREARLVAWLEAFEGVVPLRIGYAFYDCEDNGGALDVLDNPEYNAEYKDVVDNLMDFKIAESDEKEPACVPCRVQPD